MIWGWLHGRRSDEPEGLNEAAPEEIRAETRRPAEATVRLIWQDQQGRTNTATATIADASPTGFGFRTEIELQPGQTILFGRDDASLKKAVVRHCNREGDSHWRLGVKVIETERRRVGRTMARGAGEISWVSERGQSRVAPATVLDVSAFGAQVRTPIALEVEQTVCLRGEDMECLGVVRYCRKTREGYLSGLQFVREPYLRSSTASDWID